MSFKNDSLLVRFPALRIAALLALAPYAGCGARDPLPPVNPERLTIQIRSPAFTDGGMIPSKFTCDGSDRSPPLEWSGVPEKKSHTLVLICDDPDAPMGTWSHWVVFDLPAQSRGLLEGVPADETIPKASIEGSLPAGNEQVARQGKNDFGKIGYGGPCPPSGTHRYFFRLYAVDAALELGCDHSSRRPQGNSRPHPRQGQLIGKYTRGAKE